MVSSWLRLMSMLPPLFAMAACGKPEPLPSQMTPVHGRLPHGQNIQCWQGSETLRQNKTRIVNAARALGADDTRVALLVAAAMAESQEIRADQRDTSKDGMGPAKNYSAFNMNGYALAMLGWTEGQGVDLNQDCNLEQATRLFNQGLDGIGETKWLHLHRGGETAMRDGVSYGCQEYAAAIRAIAQHLLSDPSRLTDGNRYGCEIAHV